MGEAGRKRVAERFAAEQQAQRLRELLTMNWTGLTTEGTIRN